MLRTGVKLATTLSKGVGEPGTVVPWGTWSYLGGGTGVTEDPNPTLATLGSAVASPAGTGQGTSGVTCTGLGRDPTRSRYILGNHGQPVEGSVAPELSSLITLDSSLAKVAEVALDYGAPYAAIKGVQGVTVDTVADLVAVCVPSIPAINFFDPTTLLYVSRLSLSGLVAQPNGLAYDSSRDAFWVTDNVDQKIRLISKAGAVLASYQTVGRQLVGLDMLDYDAANDLVLFSSGGATAGAGYVFALDADYLRVVKAFRSSEGLAPEGVSLSLDGLSAILASDGEYHASTPSPGISAPNNVNQLLSYPIASLVDYHFARNELVGVNRRIIADIRAGTTSSDFSLYTNTVTATVTSKTFRFKARSNDGQTYAIFWRLGSTIFQGSVGPTNTYCELPNMTVAGSASFQIGLRKGGAPYNTSSFCDITIEPLRLLP